MSNPGTLTPIYERVMRHCAREDRGHITPCLIWNGTLTDKGYGSIRRGRMGEGHRRVHIVTWEHVNGAIPTGLELDHLCRQRDCCEVTHLEAVTHRVNVTRGESPRARAHRAGTCVRGHPQATEAQRDKHGRVIRCRACRRERRAAAS